jgi:hypothetical protein
MRWIIIIFSNNYRKTCHRRFCNFFNKVISEVTIICLAINNKVFFVVRVFRCISIWTALIFWCIVQDFRGETHWTFTENGRIEQLVSCVPSVFVQTKMDFKLHNFSVKNITSIEPSSYVCIIYFSQNGKAHFSLERVWTNTDGTRVSKNLRWLPIETQLIVNYAELYYHEAIL